MAHYKSFKNGDHLIICDSCGAQRYRSECDYTWDGYLMCHTHGCWYPKEAIFEIPPVINDPLPIQDVRPDQTSGTETYVDSIVGLITTFGTAHIQFGSNGKRFGHIDDAPDYIGNRYS
jgi:hypothetical protein